MEYIKLADLIEKYGEVLVRSLYIDNKMTIEEMKKAFEEKEMRANNLGEALEFIKNSRGKR